MQRIFNVTKWRTISEGKGIEFPGSRPRVVRLEVNARSEVGLYIIQTNRDPDTGEVQPDDERFLARVCGRDTVEFHSAGGFALVVDEGECEIYTVDGDVWMYVDLEPRIFTKMASRRKRSPELEYIAHQMQANMSRLLERQANEIRRDYEQRERARAAQPGPAGLPGDAPKELKTREPQEPDAGDDPDAPGPDKGGKAKKGQGKPGG